MILYKDSIIELSMKKLNLKKRVKMFLYFKGNGLKKTGLYFVNYYERDV
jgi:hypothetical protein